MNETNMFLDHYNFDSLQLQKIKIQAPFYAFQKE
jgi:hypothetical protein